MSINTHVLTSTTALNILANGVAVQNSECFDLSPYYYSGYSEKEDDGAGGGTILLYLDSFGNSYTVSTKVGNGGDNTMSDLSNGCHAPGGRGLG